MAWITRILLLTCLVLAIQGATLHLKEDVKIVPNGKNFTVSSKDATSIIESKIIPKENDAKISSKDATSIIENALNNNGAHFGSIEKFSVLKTPEKELGKAISESIKTIQGVVGAGKSKHASQKFSHNRGNGFKHLSNNKSPLVSKDKFLDMTKSKEIKFIVNNKKTTNFEVSTIKNEIFGRGNIRLQGKGDESSSSSKDEYGWKKESISTFSPGKNSVPIINMNVHNLNAPNEGLIYVNNPLPSVKPDRDQNYLLVNVSGQPALIPSVLLGKTGFVPKEKELNKTDIATSFPIFDFWPEHPIKISNDKIVSENDTILEDLKCSKLQSQLSKEKLNNLEALLRKGLSIPKLTNGCFDWEKITSHKYDFTTPIPEVVTKKVIVTKSHKTDLPNTQKEFLLKEHSKLGLPLPKNPDGSINWDLMVKHLIDADVKNKIPQTTTTTKPPTELDVEKQYLLKEHNKLGLPVPKQPDGSVDWGKVITHLRYIGTGNTVTLSTQPTLSLREQEISDLYSKLGLQLPKKPDGDIDWDNAYEYLITLQKQIKKPPRDDENSKVENEKLFILQQLSNLGIPIPKLPNGLIDWHAIAVTLNNAGTTETPAIEIPTTESNKGIIVLGKTNLLSTFQKLGLPIPTKADGSKNWDAIIKLLMEHGYKIETGKISGENHLINMDLGGRLDLLQRLQNLGLPIPKLPNGNIDWQSIYQDLISNGYNNSDNQSSLGFNINNLGLLDRLKLLEKLKTSGVNIPKLANGNLDWVTISKYFANNDGSLNLNLINRLSVQDRLRLLNQLRGLGVPLYSLPNGQYDWARILQAVRNRGIKLTGTVESINGQNYDTASRLTANDKMQLLREVTRRNLPVPSLPGGGIDWNAIVREVNGGKMGFGLKPSPGLLSAVTNLLG